MAVGSGLETARGVSNIQMRHSQRLTLRGVAKLCIIPSVKHVNLMT